MFIEIFMFFKNYQASSILTNELSPNEWTFPVTRETNKLSPRYETHGQWSIDLHTNRKLLSFIILSLDYVFTWVSLYPLGILNCTITHLICYISSRDVVYPISLSLSFSLSLYFCSSDFCSLLCLSLYTIHNISNAVCNNRFKTDAIEMRREKKKKKKIKERNEPCCRQI